MGKLGEREACPVPEEEGEALTVAVAGSDAVALFERTALTLELCESEP